MKTQPDTKIEHLAPTLRDWAVEVVAEANRLLERRQHPEMDDVQFEAILGETWRSKARHAEIYPGPAPRVRYSQTAHGVTKADGTPDSRAFHVVIVEKGTRNLAPDGHAVWGVVVAAAYIVAGRELKCGAFFKTVPGGDWMHIQQRRWGKKVQEGL